MDHKILVDKVEHYRIVTPHCPRQVSPHFYIICALSTAYRSAVNNGSPVSFLIWSLYLSGIPLFRCPLKSCLYACLTMLSLGIQQTCPNHRSLLYLMTCAIDSEVKVSPLILICCYLSALVTPLIALRQRM